MRAIFQPVIHFITHKILHIDDSPHRIAMGIAIGFLIAWTPAIGLHILLALALTSMIGANKFVAVTCVWISNIFTAVFIYYPNYLVGWYLVNRFSGAPALTHGEVVLLFKDIFTFDSFITCFYRTDFWTKLLTLLMSIGVELWVGGLVVGSAVSITVYLVSYHFIKWHRIAHPHRKIPRHNTIS